MSLLGFLNVIFQAVLKQSVFHQPLNICILVGFSVTFSHLKPPEGEMFPDYSIEILSVGRNIQTKCWQYDVVFIRMLKPKATQDKKYIFSMEMFLLLSKFMTFLIFAVFLTSYNTPAVAYSCLLIFAEFLCISCK